jgi:hypothetical protein
METLSTVSWPFVLLLTVFLLIIVRSVVVLLLGNPLDLPRRPIASGHVRYGTKKTPVDPAGADRLLYHHLQNVEYYPDALGRARDRLVQLFDLAIARALQMPESTILSVPKFDSDSLFNFLARNDSSTAEAWASYLSHRSKGGARELFPTREYCEHWLRLSTPVKYVDGAWLGRVHHANTLSQYRPFTRIAWQILSEELGDGDLSRNHVHIYSELLRSIGIDIGSGDSAQFADSSMNPNDDTRVWAAAIAQLAIGLFPDWFLPEIIGFNLAYEAVTTETLVCIYELKELNIDPTYFNLHVAIDNADSGHTAMALHAVTRFMDSVSDAAEAESLWLRIQAGFLLAKGLPVTPRPLTTTDMQLLNIVSRKCASAQPAHQCSQARFGGRKGLKLGDWMNPSTWEIRKYDFIRALANSRWIVRGNPRESRLLHEITWGGRMFGAFTSKERLILEKWIHQSEPDDLGREIEQAKGAYQAFTGRRLGPLQVERPIHHSSIDWPDAPASTNMHIALLHDLIRPSGLWRLLIAAASPLQYFIASSAKSATPRGMAVLRILRVLNGFSGTENTVAGMDEVLSPSQRGIVDIGLELRPMAATDGSLLATLGREWDWLHGAALAPDANFWFLAGVQFAFVVLVLKNDRLAPSDSLTQSAVNGLREIGSQVEHELMQLRLDQHEESCKGFWLTRRTIQLFSVKEGDR